MRASGLLTDIVLLVRGQVPNEQVTYVSVQNTPSRSSLDIE